MSTQLQKHKEYLTLLLSTNNLQARAILDTSTNEQINILSEIALNLRLIKHSKKIIEKLKNHNHLLKKLSDKKLSISNKRIIVRKYRKQIIKLLQLFKNQLLQLI